MPRLAQYLLDFRQSFALRLRHGDVDKDTPQNTERPEQPETLRHTETLGQRGEAESDPERREETDERRQRRGRGFDVRREYLSHNGPR